VLLSADGVIHGQNLPPTLQMPVVADVAEVGSLNARVEVVEREMIVDALKATRGNVSAAARQLGVTSRILRYKLGKLDIDPRSFNPRRT